jgi:hypothetical protein
MAKRITAIGKPGENEETVLARTATHPTTQAAISVQKYNRSFGELDVAGLIEALQEANKEERVEDMLTAQAHVLDAIFNTLAQRAAMNMGEGYLQATETYLKLALRAQSQARATWEALANIQNPPVMGYVRQANIAHNQQVNNFQETENRKSEQSGSDNELRPNARTPRLAVEDDSPLETLGEIHGAKVARG